MKAQLGMASSLDSIQSQVSEGRNFDTPPLHLWHPPLSGDIDIHITRDGNWFHEGGRIQRDSLVRLFASILRREEDGDYYLVTPVEKWRIRVDAHALQVVDVETGEGGELQLTLNTGHSVAVSAEHPLFLDVEAGDIAAVKLDHGLSALFNRASWYRLVELAEDVEGVPSVRSAGEVYPIARG